MTIYYEKKPEKFTGDFPQKKTGKFIVKGGFICARKLLEVFRKKKKKGTKVRLIDSDEDKRRWGGNDSPNDYLTIGEIYTVDHTEIHSWHTKVYLEEMPNKKFNSAHFEAV